MNSMTTIWILVGALLVLALALCTWAVLAVRSAAKREHLHDQARQEAESRAQSHAATAARLPDAHARAERAERQSSEQITTLTEMTAQVGALEEGRERDKAELANWDAKLSAARASVEASRLTFEALQRRAAGYEAELDSKNQHLKDARDQLVLANQRIEALQVELRNNDTRLNHAEAQRDAAVVLQSKTSAFLSEAQAVLRSSFTEAASRVFDEKAIALDQKIQTSGETSRTGLETTLKPLNDKIADFQQRLEAMTQDSSKGRAELVGKIDELKTLNQTMAAAADGLTRALKGNAKARGDWGEFVLDTVLKASGLVEGKNYHRQVSVLDEEGARRQPDVVVHLPDGRKVVVDAKLNLIDWAAATNAEDPKEVEASLIRHATALRTHMRDLATKNYPASIGTEALEITIAFVPIEGALSHALGVLPELQKEAFGKKVLFASPNTLMAMLQVVERLWTRDKLQRQVDIIGGEAAKLLDALTSFLGEFDAIEERLGKTVTAVGNARKRLNESPQSVVARARRLVDAGARGKKPLAEELMTLENEEVELLLPGSGEAAD